MMFLLAVASGCSPSDPATEIDESSETSSEAKEPLLEPFDPPPLAEIDAKADWQEMPVVDALERLEAHLAKEKPLATAAEAVKLKNDSDEANAKILSALGQPPSSPDEVNMEAVFNRHIGGDVNNLNPILVSSTSDFEVSGLTGVGLFSFDWTMTPFAAAEVVESWHSSKDRMYDKVVLRDDLTWSDGQPITAHDVAFSFQVIMDPAVPVPAVRQGTKELRWVEAYDDRTVVFFHKKSAATNVWNVNFPILPKHVYESTYKEDPTLVSSEAHAKLELEPVTGGAYEVSSRQRRTEIVLKRRESYWKHKGKEVRRKPYFETIRFRIVEDSNTALLAIKSGDIDETILSPEQWQSQTTGKDFYGTCTKVKAPEWVEFHIIWNIGRPFFKDVRVRKAMSYAMDYDELLDRLCYGLYEPCAGMFYPGAWMAPKDYPAPYTQDLDKAEDLLDEAGWEDSDGDGIRDKDGRRFEFSLMYRSDPIRERHCRIFKESLDRIGIICNLQPTEFTVLQERCFKHNFDATYGGWGSGADPYTSENIFGTDEDRNYGQYSNPEVDKLYKAAALELDRDKRAEQYGQIHKLVYEDQPYTWLYWRAAFYGFNKELRGYFMSPRGPYNYGPGSGALWRVAE